MSDDILYAKWSFINQSERFKQFRVTTRFYEVKTTWQKIVSKYSLCRYIFFYNIETINIYVSYVETLPENNMVKMLKSDAMFYGPKTELVNILGISYTYQFLLLFLIRGQFNGIFSVFF